METTLEILPNQWATTMHTQKWRITYMLRGLLQRVAMYFSSRWDLAQPELQSQNWSGNLIATALAVETWISFRYQHHIQSWKTFPWMVETLERHNHARVCPIEGSNSELLYFRLLLFGFSLCLWTLCRMNVQLPGWIHQTVGVGANVKPHELELLLTESRLAGVWKTRGNYSFSYAQNTSAHMKLENKHRRKEIYYYRPAVKFRKVEQKSTGKAREQGWQRVGQRDGWRGGWGRWSEGKRESHHSSCSRQTTRSASSKAVPPPNIESIRRL